MLPVVTAAEMRALDRATIDEIGLSAATLMETAGRACADAACRMVSAGHVAVICGPGNNGGDGFVIARVLRARGYDAVAYLALPRDQIRDEALAHLAVLERAGGVVRTIATAGSLAEAKARIVGAELVVDALFGVGLARPIAGHLADIVAAINLAPRRLAVDIPSGLATDTGEVLGVAVEAHVTVTMAAHKVALASAPGFARCGVVEVAEIGVPARLIAASRIAAHLVQPSDVARWLPRGTPLDHKGTRGSLLVVGGSVGMRGAGRMASLAALRAGAGTVTLASRDADAAAPDAVMTLSIAGALGEALARRAAIVIGCGLVADDAGRGWVAEVLASGIPAVFDAGALALVTPEQLAAAAGPIAITPHPGEAARLLGRDLGELERDRLAAARELATRTRTVVAYKGARTVVCDGTLGDLHCSINPTGSPALATGGSGDVLAGTIGALLAQGLSALDAVRAGVFIHGRAGEVLAARDGVRGAIASDLPAEIGHAIARFANPER